MYLESTLQQGTPVITSRKRSHNVENEVVRDLRDTFGSCVNDNDDDDDNDQYDSNRSTPPPLRPSAPQTAPTRRRRGRTRHSKPSKAKRSASVKPIKRRRFRSLSPPLTTQSRYDILFTMK